MKGFGPPRSDDRSWSVRRVEFGRVWCPRYGDVDVEQCLRCPRVTEVDLGAEPPFICCACSDDTDLGRMGRLLSPTGTRLPAE